MRPGGFERSAAVNSSVRPLSWAPTASGSGGRVHQLASNDTAIGEMGSSVIGSTNGTGSAVMAGVSLMASEDEANSSRVSDNNVKYSSPHSTLCKTPKTINVASFSSAVGCGNGGRAQNNKLLTHSTVCSGGCNNINNNNSSYISGNRTRTKISLDEGLMTRGELREDDMYGRQTSSSGCVIPSRLSTVGGGRARLLSSSSTCSSHSGSSHPRVDVRPGELQQKVVLARSSSYQALHSALDTLYRVDDFHLERIGQGFFSEVFKVRHKVTDEVMVLKMNKVHSNRLNMVKEVELMNRLHHRNILMYHGACIHQGQLHAVTEYIHGGSLEAVLQERSVEVSWRERVSLALDIARGMAYLHSQGVFHRDLTSKNILIKEHVSSGGRKRREAIVGDFGLASKIPPRTTHLPQVGSPYWMAPEVINGEWYDHRADIFSFGIILCEMIARCDADPDVLPRTNNFGVHYLAFSRMCQNDCPPYFLQMAFQCCQIDPESRPSFEILTRNLESLLNRMTSHRAASVHRKQKVCHRRSLSDDCLMLGRSSSAEDSNNSGGSSGGDSTHNTSAQSSLASSTTPANRSTASDAELGRTPQEVVEKIGAADPYFTPSTATVNPFTQVKLPAPSRLLAPDGARFCHSLPEPLTAKAVHHHHQVDGTPCAAGHHSIMCPSFSSSSRHQAMTPARCSGGGSHHQHHNNQQCSSLLHSSQSCLCGRGGGGAPHPCHHQMSSSPGEALSAGGNNSPATTTAGGFRPDMISGGAAIGGGPVHLIGGTVKRRGSGESGFFSVGDMDRTGTPELWLSYSELSCNSLACEDEERSWVTDSSEDLCVGPEEPDTHDTDIKAIVEFFERGYGSLKQGPLLRPRGSTSTTSRLSSPRSPASPSHCHLWGSSSSSSNTTSSSSSSILSSRVTGGLRPFAIKRDTYRVKDRPKLYITEGTVRARRDIFEAK